MQGVLRKFVTQQTVGKSCYLCVYCQTEKIIPGNQSELENPLKTGCEECGTLTRHHQRGTRK